MVCKATTSQQTPGKQGVQNSSRQLQNIKQQQSSLSRAVVNCLEFHTFQLAVVQSQAAADSSRQPQGINQQQNTAP
jgi:hypothetical protein